MESGKERLPVFATGYRRTARRKPEDHRQLSLFSRQGSTADPDRDVMEISNEAAGESISSEAAREMVYMLQCDWTLQKTGPGTWILETRHDIFDINISLGFETSMEGHLVRSLSGAFPLLELIRGLKPFSYVSGGGAAQDPRAVSTDGSPEFDPPLYGTSAEIMALKKKTFVIAASSVPVLIEGENGTGKEIIARNLHNIGPRKEKPLVIVNCMEMPATMLQGELFGHVRGAFTGAMYDRRGLVEGAAGGTFFLDEIGELPLTLQAALLRVIQEKEIRRIGESERRLVDTRFVFATNRDLAGLVAEGSFRQDLYYRIRGVRLSIPPLRERRSDIMILAHRFLVSAARREGMPAPGISNAGIRHLVAHDWPGNVRELKNEMERVIALYPGAEMVEPRMLSSTLRDNWARRGDAPVRTDRDTLPEAVQKLEQRMITRALERFDSNRTRSAEFLGITRQGLLKKLKRYRLA